MARYLMTAKRKAALRKAQLASARKRRRNYHQANKQAKTTVRNNLSRKQYGGQVAMTFGAAQHRAQKDYAWRKHNNAVKYKGKKQLTRKQINRRYWAKQAGVAAVTNALQYAAANPAGAERALKRAGRTARGVATAPGSYGKGFARGYKQSRARQAAARRNMARVNFGHATAVRVAQPALPRRGSSTRRVRGY